VTFEDIEAALIHDHRFLNPAPADDLQNARTPVARPAKRGRNGTADRTGSASGFPIRGRLSSTRITMPIAT
jgi:hypothetical protein